MKLENLIRLYLEEKSFSKQWAIEQDIKKLCDQYMTHKYNILAKYNLDMEAPMRCYQPNKGLWLQFYICDDEKSVNLTYNISYSADGYDGFNRVFSVDEVDNFNEEQF